MSRVVKIAVLMGVAAFAVGASATAFAAPGDQATPSGWSYEIKDGKRVPKANRVTNADGSWREEVRKGSCIEVKEMTAAGELKITRKCD